MARRVDTLVFESSKESLNGQWHKFVVRPLEVFTTVIAFGLLFIALIGAIPFGYLAQLTKPRHPASAWNEVFRTLFRWYFYSTGIRIEVEGLAHLPPDMRPVLLASNHPSQLDGMYLDLAVGKRRATAMTAPARSFPWPFSFWFRKIGSVDVARTDEEEQKYPETNTRKVAIEKMVYKLTELRKTMLIFPEGHIERIRHPRPYHTGAVRIALLADVPLIPVTIRGPEHVFSHWILRPGTVHVTFHPEFVLPRTPGTIDDHQLVNLLTSQLMCRISQDLPPAYYTPGMILACKEILSMHPVLRQATMQHVGEQPNRHQRKPSQK